MWMAMLVLVLDTDRIHGGYEIFQTRDECCASRAHVTHKNNKNLCYIYFSTVWKFTNTFHFKRYWRILLGRLVAKYEVFLVSTWLSFIKVFLTDIIIEKFWEKEKKNKKKWHFLFFYKISCCCLIFKFFFFTPENSFCITGWPKGLYLIKYISTRINSKKSHTFFFSRNLSCSI